MLLPLLALALGTQQSALGAPHAPSSVIRYDSQCFTINGRDVYLYSGAFHYFRCPKPLWRDRLQKLKEAHLNCVETYVPWNVHEPREGHVDLRDFEDWLRLCERMGLYVIARPGPYICAEWDAGGFPTWLPAKMKSLRDDGADSLRWSKHWFDAALPVIRRHQITQGGCIVMVQLENEYDHHPGVSAAEKKEYVRALYRMAKAAGIEVPLITCWTHAVRDRQDPDMKGMMDTCNFYPRRNVGTSIARLDTLGREQPDAPRMVTELQGGWFSQFGGKLSIEQSGMDARQENALIKTVWAGGATATNYYMMAGGTNFGYLGGKNITTTYDYAAPIREPGGLWDKYYAVRSAGRFLEQFGPLLVRSRLLEGAARTEMDRVWVAERANGGAGFLFVRSDSDEPRDGTVTATDPATNATFDLRVHLGPRGMKVLPINLPAQDAVVKRANAELAGVYREGNRLLLVLAGDPGETVRATVLGAGNDESGTPPVIERTLPADPSANPDQLVDVPNGPLVLITTADRAARVSELPWEGSTAWPVCGGFYRTDNGSASDHRLAFTAEVTPGGVSQVSVPLPRRPSRVRVGSADAPFTMGPDGLCRFAVAAGRLDIPPVRMGPVKVAKTMWGGGTGWRPARFDPLDTQGVLDNGYTRYRALFHWKGENALLLTQYATDPLLVAVNGVPVGAVQTGGTVRVDLTHVAKRGINRVEVLYENAGRANSGGARMWERKGLMSAVLLSAADAPTAAVSALAGPQAGTPMGGWELCDRLRGQRLHWEADEVPASRITPWSRATLPERRTERTDTVRWYRSSFRLPKPAASTSQTRFRAPWKLKLDAGGEALVYVNGHLVGRYSDRGPQTDFYLPECWLRTGARANIVAIALRDGEQPANLRSVAVLPYAEFATRRVPVAVEF